MNSDLTLTKQYIRLWSFKLRNIKQNIFIFIDILGNKLDKIDPYLEGL